MSREGPLLLVGAEGRLARTLSGRLRPLERVILFADKTEPPSEEIALALLVDGASLPPGWPPLPTRPIASSLSGVELRETVRLGLGENGYETLCLEAETFLERGRLAEAEAALSLAISRAPSRPEAFFLMGRLLEKYGSPFEARENYATALALGAGHEGADKALDRIVPDTRD